MIPWNNGTIKMAAKRPGDEHAHLLVPRARAGSCVLLRWHECAHDAAAQPAIPKRFIVGKVNGSDPEKTNGEKEEGDSWLESIPLAHHRESDCEGFYRDRQLP